METTEQKPLTKHIQTAVNAIGKEIEKKRYQANKMHERSLYLEHSASVLREEITGLEEQISKLKGE